MLSQPITATETTDPPSGSIKTLKKAYSSLKDFEVMRVLSKYPAAIFDLMDDGRGEARIAEQAF